MECNHLILFVISPPVPFYFMLNSNFTRFAFPHYKFNTILIVFMASCSLSSNNKRWGNYHSAMKIVNLCLGKLGLFAANSNCLMQFTSIGCLTNTIATVVDSERVNRFLFPLLPNAQYWVGFKFVFEGCRWHAVLFSFHFGISFKMWQHTRFG